MEGQRKSSRCKVNDNPLPNMSTEEKEDKASDGEDLYAVISKMNTRLGSVERGIVELKNLLLCALNMKGGIHGGINVETDGSGRKGRSNVDVCVPETNKVGQCEGNGTTGLKDPGMVFEMQPGNDGRSDDEGDQVEMNGQCDGESVFDSINGCTDGDRDEVVMNGGCDGIEEHVTAGLDGRSDGIAPEAGLNGQSCAPGYGSKSSPSTGAEDRSSGSNLCKELIVVGTDTSGGSGHELSFLEDYLVGTDIMNLTIDPEDFDTDFIGNYGLQEYDNQQLISVPRNLGTDFTYDVNEGMQLQLHNEVHPEVLLIEMPDPVAADQVPADELAAVPSPQLPSSKAVNNRRRPPRATRKPPKATKAAATKRMNQRQQGGSAEKADSPFDPLDVGLRHGEMVEFDAWCTASRRRLASRTSICMPSSLLVDYKWFENISKVHGWLKNDHLDALTCLLLHKFNRYASAELKQKRDWSVLQYPATDALMHNDIGRINRIVMPYVRGEQPFIDETAWVNLNRVFGIDHVNEDHWVGYEVNFRAQKITV